MDKQEAAGVFAPVLGRDIGELWPNTVEEEGAGTRTPGAGEVDQEAEEERDVDYLCGVGIDEDMEGVGERAEKVRRQEDREDSERGYAVRDQAGDMWAVESKEVDDKGGGGGLLAKGMGGKAAGGAVASGGKVNVSGTIRKT